MTIHPIKVLHILSQRPDSTGSGIYIQAMIREAEAVGYDNYLVAGSGEGIFDQPTCIDRKKSMYVHFNQGDLNYHLPGMSDVMPYKSSRFCDLSGEDLVKYEAAFTDTIRRAVDRFQPDMIHSHHLWLVSALVRQLFPEIPMITSCHGSDLRQFQTCPHLQERVLSECRRIDTVLALSKGQKQEISQLYQIPAEKIAIVGAGYNNALFYPQIKPPPRPIQLVYAGKLSNAKGIPWLLRALKMLPKMASLPEWRLHLVGSGSGEEKDHCLELARSLSGNVEIHGAVSQERLSEIIRSSHLLLLPSFYEGLPLVILEGLASGCRLVVTDLPGARELLGNTDSNMISFVELPRLHHIDQPDRADELAFVINLKKAIQKQIEFASYSPNIDLAPLRELLDDYTWEGVFRRVNEVYQRYV